MRPSDFRELSEVVYRACGIRLRQGKESMVSARIARRIRALGLADESAYLAHLRRDGGGELVELVDAITTNVTQFFREPDHFALLSRRLDDWLRAGATRLRIWCAAASTGEEPYTLAMIVREAERRHGRAVDARILATDISTPVLRATREGRFDAKKLDAVPADLRRRYFVPTPCGESSVARDELRDLILVRRLNLSRPPFPMRGPLDAVFCRNVMIYFDTPVRRRLVDEFRRLVRPGGLVVVGRSESLASLDSGLERVEPSVYGIAG